MAENTADARAHISTLNEKPLHAALKAWYARPGDRLEAPVDGYLVDLVRGRLLVEIQTRGFGALRRKLAGLLERHRVRLVHPMPQEKWIVRLADDGETVLSRRRSPKHCGVEHVFGELVSVPDLLARPRFSLEVLLTREEEVRLHRPGHAWRRKGWVTHERRLLEVVERKLFRTPADLGRLLPKGLAEPFTTADIAEALGRPRWLAQQMAYCLRHTGVLEQVGKRGNALLYVRGAA